MTARDASPAGAPPQSLEAEAPPPVRSNMRAIVVGVLEVVLSAGLLWVVFSHIDFSDVKGRLAKLSYASAILVAALMLLHAFLSAIRWRALIAHFGGRVGLWPAVSGVLVERFVNQAVPSPLGGDGARFVEMTTGRQRQSLRLVASSIIIDRVFALAGIFGVVSIVLPLAPWVIRSDSILKSLMTIGALPLVGLAALILVPHRWWEALRQVPLLRYPTGLVMRLRGVVVAPRIFAVSAGISILAQMLPIPCFLILAHDLHIPLGTLDAAVVVPVIMLAAVLPISVAGWGVREGAAVVLFGQVGVASSDAILLSVLFGLIGLATGCFGGLVWLAARYRLRRRAAIAAHRPRDVAP